MISKFITESIRKYLVGSGQDFTFRRADSDSIQFTRLEEIGLYVHIPFCKSLCPYCPYCRIPYDKKLASEYLEALLKEIDLYKIKVGKVEISSIYIGGGTPTNLIDELGTVLKRIKEVFFITGDIGIETSPYDVDEKVVKMLKDYGINLLSLGVQSFQDRFLKMLGRNYTSYDAYKAVETAISANFDSVNIDFMFDLPGQTVNDVLFDLKEAIVRGVTQLTVYPFFTFSYSLAGERQSLKRVKMPGIFRRKSFFYAIYDFLLREGFERVSVWGFKKGPSKRFSSVTRNYYIGLGAGAGSRLPNVFYFNTFSVREYLKVLREGSFPIALKMDISESLSRYYWFYWQIYNTYFSLKELKEVFNRDRRILKIFRILEIKGFFTCAGDNISLTKKGTFWVHLVQNYFILNYIDKVWSKCLKEAWPEEIKI
ncbi:MAG: coproporphyrinogen-III oxidase family protein [Caldiserica bacterium]|nr:coproporphyrinogen-III oxidase family protein [Caldisericota bacterium]